MHGRAARITVRELADRGVPASEIARRAGIPGSTVREWLRHPRRYDSEAATECIVCAGEAHRFSELPGSYAYLLGLYLGDGCLSKHPRGVYKLRIALDAKYRGIVEECSAAIEETNRGNAVNRSLRKGYVEVYSYSKSWPCLLPQHGTGKKHLRSVSLASWQRDLVGRWPELLLRGLIQSDGSRFMNTGRGRSYPRYNFTNLSRDVQDIFCEACDQLGLRWTRAGEKTIYVSRKSDVAILDCRVVRSDRRSPSARPRCRPGTPRPSPASGAPLETAKTA